MWAKSQELPTVIQEPRASLLLANSQNSELRTQKLFI